MRPFFAALLALSASACGPCGILPPGPHPFDTGFPDEAPSAFPSAEGGCEDAPSLSDLEAFAPVGAADLAFGPDCRAWISTIVSGADQVVVIDRHGIVAAIDGHADWNIPSLALAPDGRGLAVAHNDNSSAGIARVGPGDTALELLAEATLVVDGAWDNRYLQRSAASIAWGEDGCIWVPNLHEAGTLSCVRPDGAVDERLAGLDLVHAVARDAAGGLVLAAGGQVLAFDSRTGEVQGLAQLEAEVLDLVVDDDGAVVLETDDGTLWWLPPWGEGSSMGGGGAPSPRRAQEGPRPLATVDGQGRLVLHPDGGLVRMVPEPGGHARFARVELRR